MAAKPGSKQSHVLSSIPFDRTFTGERVADDIACVPADAQFLVGARIRDPDRYQIIGEHGRGGLGCVSRAHDRELGRDVAIKELISRGNLSEVRFMREALITARLEHPGIVPVHEAGRWPDGTPFYAMKLVAGRPLRDLIAERPVEQRIGLLHHVIAVADAIAYAHGRNIIHRDLKPANVIVGDFGETVVIDWGLAKDLSAPDDAAGGPARVTPGHDRGLTSTGNVMGTPAYMAPEQERGERVDQRADVFAIGAMLWELCAHNKVPPIDRVLRRRTLRRAGVDRDLIAIIEKSLEPEPVLRYPHAGALAADLKAFKAGARISARGYSLPAMLVHWAHRHRGLAFSVAAAIAVALAGGALYVRTIAAERDRAEASNNRLLLEQADRLLTSDPTAAADSLQTYRGRDTQKLAMLRAKAEGLGLARMRAQPHTQTIYLAQPLPDGTLLTLGDDGTVAKTTPDGKSRVIARGVAPQYTFNYNDKLHLLAYACNGTGLCLLDVDRETLRPPPADRSALAPTCLGSSPDRHLLTALSPRGELSVWTVNGDGAPETYYRTRFEDGEQLRFIDDEAIAVETTRHLYIVHLPAPGRTVPDREPFGVAGVAHSVADEKLHVAAGASEDGAIVVIDSETHKTTRSRPVCRSMVNRLMLISDPPSVAFGCQEGDAGILDLARDKASVLSFLEGGVTRVAASADGRYVFFTGDASRPLGTIHDSVALVRIVPQTERAVIAGAKGALWLAGASGPGIDRLGSGLEPLGNETDSLTSVACSPDARWLVVGTAAGRVSLYDLASGARHRLFNGNTWIEFVGFSSDSRQILFSTNGRMRIAGIEREPDGEPRLVRGPGSLELSAHFAAFSPDNTWLAATGDQGDLWFHRASDERWVYVATGIAKLSQGVFSLDGTQLVATDPSGRALIVDMRAPAFH